KDGRTRITIPARFGDGGVRTPNFVGRPVRNKPVWGVIQGKNRQMYDLTAEQYDSLIKLTATLCKIFPKIKCDYPRDASGKLVTHKLSDSELENYKGVMGHFHVQTNKTDPGPALQWDYITGNARRLMRGAGSEHGVEAR